MYASSIAETKIAAMVKQIDAIPPSVELSNILTVLTAALSFLGVPSFGASLVGFTANAAVKGAPPKPSSSACNRPRGLSKRCGPLLATIHNLSRSASCKMNSAARPLG